MPSSRGSRRLLFALLALPFLFFLILYLASRPALSNLFFTTDNQSKLPSEIFGLLHFVTSPDEAPRAITVGGDSDPIAQVLIHEHGHEYVAQLGGAVVPEKPIPMTWYALGSIARASDRGRVARPGRGGPLPTTSSNGWDERLRTLGEEYPLVVFSKSYCPYSKRAKKLLEMYDIAPTPKIIEVDLRPDASHIKTVLTRLTHRSTFPNVILLGRSLGGSDDLIRMHEEDSLRGVLETAGLSVKWSGEGGEGVVV